MSKTKHFFFYLTNPSSKIEDAAKQLREVKAQPRKLDNVADAILGAALAITEAIAQLMKAAAMAQKVIHSF